MWDRPWKYKEGFVIGLGLLITGEMLHLSIGLVDWKMFAFPVNLVILFLLLAFIGIIDALKRRVYAFRFLGSYHAAIPALFYAVVLTAVMGMTRQSSFDPHSSQTILGISQMLSYWPFILIYVWMVVILGQIILKRLFRLRLKDIPFMLNHVGLFLVLISATLGNADMKRLKMTITKQSPEWRGVDELNQVHELPLAIQLNDFSIDEYPPKLMIFNTETNQPLPQGKPMTLLLDSTFHVGRLMDWEVRLIQKIETAAPVMSADTTDYVVWNSSGAVTAALVEVTSSNGKIKRGWVTNNSYLFPYQTLPLSKDLILVMPEREPQRYVSNLEVLTKSGKHIKTKIEVNKPLKVEGWKIYQVSYDISRGKWSEISVLELVSDPWLPLVYTGIWMMLAGAVCMFVLAQKGKEEQA